ncbi:hypothetical protein FBU59_005074 [Linderina macrospora]|uniref:Uncharacterized protein n=1 Tax=Linderina macrospora TaxID=4868 RepID=A0ACC1J3U5_9FUNG|nr:hypothetical protein FBU59_005074 [Linderina macrospora]
MLPPLSLLIAALGDIRSIKSDTLRANGMHGGSGSSYISRLFLRQRRPSIRSTPFLMLRRTTGLSKNTTRSTIPVTTRKYTAYLTIVSLSIMTGNVKSRADDMYRFSTMNSPG